MTFEPHAVAAFRVAAAHFDEVTGTAAWDFELRDADGEVVAGFRESVTFALGDSSCDANARERLSRVLALAGLALGLSYFKAAAPGRFEVGVPGVTDEALLYLAELITHGLAEFAYRTQQSGPLRPDVVRVGAGEEVASALRASTLAGAPLVLVGGGKDSVVSVESLRRSGLAPVQFAVNPNAIIERVAVASGLPFVSARRTLDPALLALNAAGALNGHVPVTAMNTLLGVAQSILLGLGPVVLSNEASASDPTLDWNGFPVNHQWSKSLDAERALARALRAQAGLADATFSLVRPFSELRIARGFAHTTGYDDVVVSCNRAFRLRQAEPTWCGDCDKCRFVFLVFAPWLSRDRLVGIVGRDLFADPGQVPGFSALLGLDAHKPFECVGEEAESAVAVALCARSPEWADSVVIRALIERDPTFASGDPAVEARILGEAESDPLPSPFEEARRALV